MVGRERSSKSTMATAVSLKGGGSRFPLGRCLDFIDDNCDRKNKIMIKIDNEPRIKYVVDDIVQSRDEGRTIIENAPKKWSNEANSGSNGIVERAVQDIECHVRAIFLSLQERPGGKLDSHKDSGVHP